MLVLKDFKRVEGDHRAPAPGFCSCFLDPIASPVDSFIYFWRAAFKTGCSTSAGAFPRLREWQESCVWPPLLVLFCLFHKSMTLLPMFSSWSAGTLSLEAFPRALSSSAEHFMCSCSPRFWLKRGTLFAHGPSWIGPFVFFRLFLWLSRSFWILSLPAGYLQSRVAFHYINKFTVYYLVAVRPGPCSVLYPVNASGGSWLLFFFFFFNKCE